MAACSTTVVNTGGPRPPQGPGPAGTNFGFWDRDAEGAVDQDFRRFIGGRWQGGQEAEARKVFETDGFTCRDGNRPDGAPVPELECERVYSVNDNVHSWTVKFWPNQDAPGIALCAPAHARPQSQLQRKRQLSADELCAGPS